MPPPVRRKLPVLVLLVGAALAFVSVAYAGNGGFAPETPASPNAERIKDSYLWISIFALAIFALVEGTLIVFIIRYRRGKRLRTAEGPQVHGATRLELIWTAIPVLILAAIAGFIFYELPGIKDVPSREGAGRAATDPGRRPPVLLAVHLPERDDLDRRAACAGQPGRRGEHHVV